MSAQRNLPPQPRHGHVLLDLSDVPHACCDHTLETLHKAIAEDGSHLDLLWAPHDNPWLVAICEEFTRQGLAASEAALTALLGALGLAEQGGPLLAKADLEGRWTPEEIAAVKAKLQRPIEQYSPDDWLALIDLIIQTKIPPAATDAAAGWLAWRAQLAGRMEAASKIAPGIAPHAAMLSILTGSRAAKAPQTAAGKGLWGWAKARIGVHLTAMMDGLRARVARTILSHVQEQGLGTTGKLAQRLFDDFAELNRDWRRVAITEAGEAANLAYLSEFKTGTRVKRLEAYQGACPFCRKINGQVFTWSEQPLGDEFGWTHVWPGKTNVGRSAAPRKRTPEGLVERTEDELWWPASGTQHPNCRGRWLALPPEDETGAPKLPPGVDPDFAAWLHAEVAKLS